MKRLSRGLVLAIVTGGIPVTSRFTVSLIGQNLFSPQHAEFAGLGAVVTPTRIPRSARVQLAWRY